MICNSFFFTKYKQQGFTLVEMMIVIAIAAILLATAAPSFQVMVIKSNVEALQDDFANAVITARTEAASRGKEVRVCPLSGCGTSNWRDGWKIEIDRLEGSTTVQDEIASFPNKTGYAISVRDDVDVIQGVIAFNAQGYNATESRFVFAVCGPDEVNPTVVKGVTVERTGRAYHTKAGSGASSYIHTASFEDGSGGKTQAATLNCSQS